MLTLLVLYIIPVGHGQIGMITLIAAATPVGTSTAIFAGAKCSVVFGVLALVSLIPVLVYQTQVMQNKREGKTKEW